MKKLFYLAAIAMMTLAASCTGSKDDQNDTPPDETLEVNAANLAGTWEAFVEHDFAQGYMQKYRITFGGNAEYTMWHMYQELKRENGEWKGLTEVGDKFSGTWEYTGTNLELTHKKAYASYYISNMSPLEYTYNPYNVETMEANPWQEYSEFSVSTMEKLEWRVISLTKDALTVKINMYTFKLEKK